jgi:hypothetical protein
LELLNGGANVHDRDRHGLTPLKMLLGFTQYTKVLSNVLISWFEILREAEYDIQGYLRAEYGLPKTGSLKEPALDELLPPWNKQISRSMAMQSVNDTATFVFTVTSGYKTTMRQPSPPGGWKDEYDMPKDIDPPQIEETSILVGPLENGLQKIRVYP